MNGKIFNWDTMYLNSLIIILYIPFQYLTCSTAARFHCNVLNEQKQEAATQLLYFSKTELTITPCELRDLTNPKEVK